MLPGMPTKKSRIFRSRDNCLIVIPFHKLHPNPKELLSLLNTAKQMRKWDIRIVLPYGLSRKYYLDLIKSKKLNIEVQNLPKGFLGSLTNYNNMCLDPAFYKIFHKYENILIVHLDAWIFRDDLSLWLAGNYHYIGAPWFLTDEPRRPLFRIINKFFFKNNLKTIPIGGNGGFNLRNIDAILHQLQTTTKKKINLRLLFKINTFLFINRKLKLLVLINKLILEFRFTDISYYDFRNKYKINEDVLISIGFPLFNKNFKVADPRTSLAFAVETYSRRFIYTQFNFKTPFGMHGWFVDFDLKELLTINARSKNKLSRIAW